MTIDGNLAYTIPGFSFVCNAGYGNREQQNICPSSDFKGWIVQLFLYNALSYCQATKPSNSKWWSTRRFFFKLGEKDGPLYSGL